MAGKKKGSSGLSEAAAKLGRAGGKVGGKARARVLTAGERTEIARLGGIMKAKKAKNGKK
jgi:hypothetical protein